MPTSRRLTLTGAARTIVPMTRVSAIEPYQLKLE